MGLRFPMNPFMRPTSWGYGLGSIRTLSYFARRNPVSSPINAPPLKPRASEPTSRRLGALALKKGMTSLYDAWGVRHAVTVLHLDDCQALGHYVNNGKSLIAELGIGRKSERQLHLAQKKYFERCGVTAKRRIRGFGITEDAILPAGTPIYAAHFVAGQFVDVQARSIGKGFQGAMKRWGFRGMPASHGCSLSHRAIGATGARSDPGKVFKGKKMAGRMGGSYVTVRKLRILKIDNALNCVFVKGAVPGHDNQVVRLVDSPVNPIFKTSPPPFPTFIPYMTQTAPLPREMLAPRTPRDPLSRVSTDAQ